VLGASLLGLAPGPFIVGLVSDATDLKTALTVAPLISLVAAALFLLASRSYESDVGNIEKEADRSDIRRRSPVEPVPAD
jgi:hypothetical protein